MWMLQRNQSNVFEEKNISIQNMGWLPPKGHISNEKIRSEDHSFKIGDIVFNQVK